MSRGGTSCSPPRGSEPWGALALALLLVAGVARAQTSVDRAYVSVTAAPGTLLGERVGWLTQRRQLDVFLSLPQARDVLGAHYVRETTLRVAHALNVRLAGPIWVNTSAGLIVANGFALLDARRRRIDAPDLGAGMTPSSGWT